MAERTIVYKCSRCDCQPGRDALTVKRIQFREMGVGGKVTMTRVVAWLCGACLAIDPDFSIPAYESAPGTDAKKSTPVMEVDA